MTSKPAENQIISNCIDITNSEKEQLEKTRNIFLQLEKNLSLIPSAFYWKDAQHRFLGANQAALQYVGFKDVSDVLYKTDYDIWPPEFAERFIADDKHVLTTGEVVSKEDVYTDIYGAIKYCQVIKAPLYDEDNNIVGIIGNSIDITAQKEAERLRLENDKKFRKIVEQVIHDIRSPIATMQMVLPHCEINPEHARVTLKKSASRIQDIANQLLVRFKPQYAKDENTNIAGESKVVPTLVSADILEIVSEKKFEYSHLSVDFTSKITQAGYFAFINIDVQAFRRMMSNLINNAVDALKDSLGLITVHLDVGDKEVKIIVEDDGCGMPESVKEKILSNIAVTEGKADGHGIGFEQIRDTLNANHGRLTIKSASGIGTKIILTFPPIETPEWICNNIALKSDDFIIILDDDPSIHGAWDARLEKSAPDIKYKHFEKASEAIKYINNLSDIQKNHVFMLTDYELLRQGISGLEVIAKTGITRSVLVTSHYNNKEVCSKAKISNTKILPKPLAAEVAITIANPML